MNDSRNKTQFTIHAAGIEWKMLGNLSSQDSNDGRMGI